MRIHQIYSVLKFFLPSVMKKYNLAWYRDVSKPCVFWGCYPATQRKIISHKGFAVIVWRGGDAMNLSKYPSFINWMKDRPNQIKHIAISNFIERDLDKAGLPYISLPLTSMPLDVPCMPRGNRIYAYGGQPDSKQYNIKLCQEISIKSGIPIIMAYKDSYSRQRLIHEVYREAFIGLRLIEHDGLSNSVIELGLAGRNCVYKGATPNAIPYRDTKDILQIVTKEFRLKGEDNSGISQRTRDFATVGDEWLRTTYYK